MPNLSHLFLACLLCLRFRGISCSILMLQTLCVRQESLFLIFTRWPLLGLKAPVIPCTTLINHWSLQLELWSDFLLKYHWDNGVLQWCLTDREKERIILLPSIREDHCFSQAITLLFRCFFAFWLIQIDYVFIKSKGVFPQLHNSLRIFPRIQVILVQ